MSMLFILSNKLWEDKYFQYNFGVLSLGKYLYSSFVWNDKWRLSKSFSEVSGEFEIYPSKNWNFFSKKGSL